MGDVFKPDPSFVDELLKTPEMKSLVKGTADEVATEVKRIARAEAYDEGDYHDGIEPDVGFDEKGELTGRVVSTDFKTNWIEFGTSEQKAKAPLRRALETILGTQNTVRKR